MIVLDPPRDGIHPKALPKILDYGVEKYRVYFLQGYELGKRFRNDTGERIPGGEMHGGGSILSDGPCRDGCSFVPTEIKAG